MGMPPMVSSADAASAQSVLYSAASLQNPGMLQTTPGQTDLGQYGLVNQTLLDYNHAAVDPSAAGMSSQHNHSKLLLSASPLSYVRG